MSLAPSDHLLLERFSQTRDEEAFALIIQRYAGLVFGTCLRILRDSSRAEDAAQETFLRLMHRPGAVTHSLPGWLHQAATRLALDSLRSESRRHQREAAYAAEHPAEPSTWQEISPCVDECLAELADGPRTLLVRHFLEARSLEELAGQNGTSASTMHRRIQDALETLRGKLRRKGLAVAAAPLALWLTNHVPPVPPAGLMLELRKMAMVSGAGPVSAPPAIIGRPAPTLSVPTIYAIGALAMAAIVVLMIILGQGRFLPSAGRGGPPEEAPAVEK